MRKWSRKTSDWISIFMLGWCTGLFLFNLINEEGWFRIFICCFWVLMFAFNAEALRMSRNRQRWEREQDEREEREIQKMRDSWPLN